MSLFESPVKSVKDLPDLKYYPIFDKRWQSSTKEARTPTPKHSTAAASPGTTKFKSKKPSPKSLLTYDSTKQYVLNFGNQASEASNRCRVCRMIYTPNEINDEKQHKKYHETVVKGIAYTPWKGEVLLEEFDDGKVILIKSNSNPGKLKQFFDQVTEELGLCIDFLQLRKHSVTLLFISNKNSKRIVGLLTGERITTAYKLLREDPLQCTNEETPTQFGVSLLWVHSSYRRNKICTRMLDAFRRLFAASKSSIAISQPSVQAIKFAKNYFKTSDILVYEMSHFSQE